MPPKQTVPRKQSIKSPVKTVEPNQVPKRESLPPPPPPKEPAPEVKPEPPKAATEELERKNSNNPFGNLLPHVGSDHWDEELIPESLCCQVHDEMITPPSSSEESYDSTDSRGKVVRKKRHKIHVVVQEQEEEEPEVEEEEVEVKRWTSSLPDIILEGWTNKGKLRSMTLQQLQSALNQINEEIEVIQTENLVFDRTVQKMEKREIEIEAALPPFTYKFPWEIQGAVKGIEIKALVPDAVCGQLSDDEPEPPDGIYRPYIPAEDPDIDREAIAQMLQVGEDGEGEGRGVSVTGFLKSFGEIPPANFDVIRHKYGDLVRFATYEPEEGQAPFEDPFAAAMPKDGQAKNTKPPDTQESVDELNEDKGSRNNMINISSMVIPVGDFEEDPEFPGFNPREAKRLPIGEKIKYAQIEEENLREDFLRTETTGIQQENSIQVYVDTYSDSYDLSVKMMDAFKAVIADGAHHLTGKMRAEKIRRFRDKLKKRFLEEEAKVKIKLTENMKKKRRVDLQLKVAQDIGGTIQMIDYENLRVQNFEFQSSIEDQQDDLKKLKFITAEWFEKLERNKDRLNRLVSKRQSVEADIAIRKNLKGTLNVTVENTVANADAVNNHCTFLKKRLLAFSAPSTLEYISQKSTEHRLVEEVELLRAKLEIMKKNLANARKSYSRILAVTPDKNAMRQTTETWLEEIKKEVKENNLMGFLEDEDAASLDDFANYRGVRQSSFGATDHARKSLEFFSESKQSSLYVSGMTQSVMELYKIGKEKKRLSHLRHAAELNTDAKTKDKQKQK